MSEQATSKILIVDDDEGVTQTFARMLRLEGYQVRTAVSAETGLAEAESPPDAIILDLRMPLSTASASCAGCARTTTSVTPVAIVTGDYFLDDASRRAARARRRAALQAAVARRSRRARPQPAQGDALNELG